MLRTLEASAIIRAHDATGKTFAHVAAKMKAITGTAAAINRTAAQVSRAEAAAARGTTMIAASASRVLAPAALGYAAAQAFKRFADAEMALTRIGITADATDEQIDGLTKTLRNLAAETGKPFGEVAEGLNQLVAGGLDLPVAMPAMPAIVRTAQAAGAEVRDIANSALAASQALGIAGKDMEAAFDVMVAGGKAGKFELKDMARYLPSIAPAAAAVGMRGEEGLKRIVAMLQVIRNGTGSVEEAASSAANIFAKMESEETTKRFSKFGIDLRKEMAKARREGRDLLEVFTDLTARATGGDLSKIPQLFSDMEFARGMRALLSYRDLMADVLKKLENAKGSVARDFERVTQRSQVAINRLAESWDRATAALGRLIDAAGGSSALAGAAKALETIAERFEAPKGEAPRTVDELRDRLLGAADKRRLAELDRDISLAERDVAAADATAAKRPGLGRDPASARARLSRLRSEREVLRLNLDARALPLPSIAPSIPLAGGGRLPATVIDRDMRAYFASRPSVPPPAPPPGAFRRAAWPPVAPLDAPPAAGELAAALGKSGRPLTATLEGRADVGVNVKVDLAPDLKAKVDAAINARGHLRSDGVPRTGTAGDTGTSMPETGMYP